MKMIMSIFFINFILSSCLNQHINSQQETKQMQTNAKNAKLPNFDKMWDYAHPAKTEKSFRALLTQAKESGEQSYYLQLLTQIARTEGLQQKFTEAHKILDIVEKDLKSASSIVRIRYLLERGRVFNSSEKVDKARPLFLQAWNLGKQTKNPDIDIYTIDAAHMMGIIEKPSEALKWNEKAILLAETSSDKNARLWLGSLYNNVGWTYFDMKNYDRAMSLFQKDYEWYKKRHLALNTRIAKWSLAKTKRMQGKIQQALKMQQEILQEIQNTKAEPDGYVYEEIGECLLLLNNENKASEFFKKAFELLSKDNWFVSNEPKRLERLNKLSKTL